MTVQSALYIVPTPIGNMSDITLRALDILRDVDVIAAEDTRHSAKLLQQHGITTPMLSYHDHGHASQSKRIFDKLTAGESVALISDAGTPLISDPGYRLVTEARAHGFTVIALPGPCAFVTALSAAGLPSDRFCFEGFPPAKSQARLAFFQALANEARTLIFYESSHRIEESLAAMVSVFGESRSGVVGREITKTFETYLSGSLSELAVRVREDENQRKGEFVVMVAGLIEGAFEDGVSDEAEKIMQVLVPELGVKQASGLAAKITGEKKNKLYQWALDQSD